MSASPAPLRYKCLILDHDDTSVDSTASIHYPAHVAGVKELLGEGVEACSLEKWFYVNHEPGVAEYLRELFGKNKETGEKLTEEEYQKVHEREIAIWREYEIFHFSPLLYHMSSWVFIDSSE